MKRELLGRFAISSMLFVGLCLFLIYFSQDIDQLLLACLPLIYGVFFISIAKIHRYINHPGMFVLTVISTIRYVLLPILIIISPEYIDKYGYLTQGIIFMIYEAISLGIFLIFITKKYYTNKKYQENVLVNNNSNFILKFIVIYALLIVILDPSILSQYNFVFVDNANLELIKRSNVVSGLSGLIVDWGKLLLPLLICIPLISRYKITNNNIYFYSVISVILLINVMIFSGTSRNSVIMPATASMFFLIKAFPDKRKKITFFMSLAIIVVAVQLTLLKTDYIGTRIQASLGSIVDYLEAYFGGAENMGIVIGAKEEYSHMFTLKTFMNDVLGNFPGLSHLFNLENRTSTFYNLIFYNGGQARDQIIPSMGQGLFYFGYLFSFIPQILIVWGMAKLDSLYRNAKTLVGIYFLSYFAVRFGFTYIQNISIILNFIYSMVIPISILLLLNQTFRFRRSNVYGENQNIVCNKQYKHRRSSEKFISTSR